MRKCGIKKIISLALSFVMILSLCLVAVPGEVKAAEGGTITVNASATHNIDQLRRGDTVTITASISGNTSASGTVFSFKYDSDALELNSDNNPVKGEAFTGAYVGSLVDKAGIITAAIAKDEGTINGTVFTAVFRVKDTAKGEIETAITNIDFTKYVEYEDTGEIEYFDVDCDVVNNASPMKVVVPAEGISLDTAAASIAKGATQQLTATLQPADSTSAVSWSSSNESVATVDQNGLVTAVGKGSATITAAAEGHSASCTVDVKTPLQSIAISGTYNGTTSDSGLTIKKGTSGTLSVAYTPDDAEHGTVTWESSDPDKAKVESTGANTAAVTAIADTGESPVTITATVGGVTDTFSIKVQEVKMTGIAINKSATTIHRGEEETLSVTYTPADTTDDRKVTWSSDSNVATVDGNGKVTAVAVGTANITATVGNFTETCAVTVDAPLKSIVPKESSISLVKRTSQIIGYTLNPTDTTDSKDVAFSSDDENVATVNPSTGEVTAVAEGTATITLTGANGVTAAVTVTVTEIPINSVMIDKNNAVVEKGESVDLTGTIGPSDTTDDDVTIKWESSDDSIVTVSPKTSNSGDKVTVTATDKGGNATITATAGKGKKAVCEIMVPIHMTGISTPVSITLNRNDNLALKAEPDPSNTTDDTTVAWTSSDPSVATVDPNNGTVTALKEGKTNITAKTTVTKDKNGNPYESTTAVEVKEIHLDKTLGDTIVLTAPVDAVLKSQSLNMNSMLNLEKIKEENGITDDTVIEWKSSDESVATIDQNGLVTGLKEGKTTITAIIRAFDGSKNETGKYEVNAEIEIKEIPLNSIAFDKVITEMQVGATDILHIIYNPENTTDLRDVQWSSSDPSVLSVEDGKLTALKVGTAKITAKVGDKVAECEITVKAVSAGGEGAGINGAGGNNAGVLTGDQANVIYYLTLILISLIAILAVYIMRYRKVRQ